ncbi:MAG: hypothetical protein L3K09_01680 [Thermoplasmata archaeon]|nr:hypothetical protein [Thermoplasmata archaeon]
MDAPPAALDTADPATTAPSVAGVPAPPPSVTAAPAPSAGLTVRKSWMYAVIAVVVVLALVVGSLWAAGVGPFVRAPTPLPSNATFSQARAAADRATNPFRGGGWMLIGAAGISSQYGATLPFTGYNLTPNCSLVPIPGGAQSLTLPAAPASGPAGAAPLWLFIYRNSSLGVLVVTISGGSAQLAATLSPGNGCTTYEDLSALVLGVSGSVTDSPQAISAANSVGGSAFLTAHPGATIALLLGGPVGFGGVQVRPAAWMVTYTLCHPTSGSSATEPYFNATVDASTGQATNSGSGNRSCATSGIPLPTSPTFPGSKPGSALSFGSPVNISSGYRIPVDTATSGLTTADLSVEVVDHSGVLAGSPGEYVTAEAASGCELAVFDFSSGTWVSPSAHACNGDTGATAPVSSGDSWLLTAPISLSGDFLVALGTGSYSGSTSVILP